MRWAIFVRYVLLGLALTSGVSAALVLRGADYSTAQGAANLIAMVLILKLAPSVGMSKWWVLAAIVPFVVWIPMVRIAWALSDQETKRQDTSD